MARLPLAVAAAVVAGVMAGAAMAEAPACNTTTHFACPRGPCIPIVERCDGVNNVRDDDDDGDDDGDDDDDDGGDDNDDDDDVDDDDDDDGDDDGDVGEYEDANEGRGGRLRRRGEEK